MKGRPERGTPEILAPAGSLESVYAAVRCGAGAVYIGGKRFSARAGAENFTPEEAEKAVNYCHLHNVKIYQALNTLIFDSELSEFLNAAKLSAQLGIDAFIVQDIGAAAALREALPDMRLHASTQMSVHTKQGALLAKEMGFSRVVAARELSLSQLEDICSADIEIEAFVHGALCMSVSGQCYMSAMIGSRSANRGMCAQACRLPFSACGQEERYDLSLKDMSYVSHIDELRNAGVASLKIEGRMKRAEYVAAAVSAVRAAADGEKPDIEKLRSVFSRSGFTDGYLTGKTGAEMFGIRRKEDVTAAEAVLPELRELYRKERKSVQADIRAVIKEGKPAELTVTADGISVTVNGKIPEDAVNRPSDLTSVGKQLLKLGDTPYYAGILTAEIDGGLVISAAELNAMRREAVGKLDDARLKAKKKTHTVNDIDLNFIKTLNIKPKRLRVSLNSVSQIDGVPDEAEMIILPLRDILNSAQLCVKYSGRLCAALPRFSSGGAALTEDIKRLAEHGVSRILCTNIAHIYTGRAIGAEMHGGFGLNVTNSLSLKKLSELGLKDTAVSFELKLPQISSLGDFMPYGIIAYGRLPLMLTKNCPIKHAAGGCKNCTGALTDRTFRRFPVRCDGTACEILNSDVLVMSDKLDEFDADFIQLDFYSESADEVRRISECYIKGVPTHTDNMTRGLYYRGIM